MSEPEQGEGALAQGGARRGWIFLVPLAVFAALAGLFFFQLRSGEDSSLVPSVLIGKPAPQVALQPLGNRALFETTGFSGKVTVVNVFASWCVPCRDEAPYLMELTRDDRFVLAGLNYKDKPDNAEGFLAQFGDPYDVIGSDLSGRGGIEWGVYGVPETYIVGRDGMIRYKHVGPLGPSDMAGAFGKALEAAMNEPA